MRSTLCIPPLYRSQVHYKLGKGVLRDIAKSMVRLEQLGNCILQPFGISGYVLFLFSGGYSKPPLYFSGALAFFGLAWATLRAIKP